MRESTSLPAALKLSVSEFPSHPAIVFGERITEFTAFDQASDRVAAYLHQAGIRKGDRVGLYCINSDIFAIAYFGILKAGGVVVPINLLLNPKEVQGMAEIKFTTKKMEHFWIRWCFRESGNLVYQFFTEDPAVVESELMVAPRKHVPFVD